MHMYSAHSPKDTSLRPDWHLGPSWAQLEYIGALLSSKSSSRGERRVRRRDDSRREFPLYLYFGYFFTTSTEGLSTHHHKTTAPQLSPDNREPPLAEIEPLWIHDPE